MSQADEEKAKAIVLAVDLTYSYAQIPVELRPILEKEIAKAIAVVREECATVAENESELDGEPEPYMVEKMREVGLVETLRAAVRATKKSIAQAIRGSK